MWQQLVFAAALLCSGSTTRALMIDGTFVILNNLFNYLYVC